MVKVRKWSLPNNASDVASIAQDYPCLSSAARFCTCSLVPQYLRINIPYLNMQ